MSLRKVSPIVCEAVRKSEVTVGHSEALAPFLLYTDRKRLTRAKSVVSREVGGEHRAEDHEGTAELSPEEHREASPKVDGTIMACIVRGKGKGRRTTEPSASAPTFGDVPNATHGIHTRPPKPRRRTLRFPALLTSFRLSPHSAPCEARRGMPDPLWKSPTHAAKAL